MKRIRAFRLGGLGEIRQIETLLNRDDAARMGVFATSVIRRRPLASPEAAGPAAFENSATEAGRSDGFMVSLVQRGGEPPWVTFRSGLN